MAMAKFGREHYGGSDLRRVCAWKGADYDIIPEDAPVMTASTFLASSGASIRTTLMSDSSLALRTTAPISPP